MLREVESVATCGFRASSACIVLDGRLERLQVKALHPIPELVRPECRVLHPSLEDIPATVYVAVLDDHVSSWQSLRTSDRWIDR